MHKTYNSNFMPCHRLDRNTLGLVLFSKNDTVNTILTEKFKNHEIEKHYIAKVYGMLPKKNDTLIHYLFKDTKKSIVYISDKCKPGYKKIITFYNVLSYDKEENSSVLDINLKTGRLTKYVLI